MSHEPSENEWVDDEDDDFTELDKKLDNDQEIMKLTGISQSYYDVGAHHFPTERTGSPLSERSFHESDLDHVERSLEQPSSPYTSSNSKKEQVSEISEASWWEKSAVGVVVVLGALSVMALSRKK
eukprot:CAMPEP_0114429546 /NCGR_PEP_ID=MMETSP0103-20121206/9550_1 /TAXON_ID=37642 ORGANISM="Paraphysomonas imperforata, Strain PA2" /NCGR_SAMPLE_ID=MMETSP0103 /ASSEMBLY_ACC=CAM_ASM_000201 /LENGTH=124 /DNA_ID=CAMNT_0001598903 /DNA_START=129 /DNA_END=503 /DNA_ORIENTATION=+